MVYGDPVCRLRGRLLPLGRLAAPLGVQAGFWGPERASASYVRLQQEIRS